MATAYASYDELRRARSHASLRSASSLMSSPSASSLASGSSRASKWQEHVAYTNMRNERIRLQAEATKLRGAFVNHDQRLAGSIPLHMVRPCLKAGGVELPDQELRAIMGNFKTSEGHFAWLRFCETLEKGRAPPAFHPLRASRPSTALLESPSTLTPSMSRTSSVSAAFGAAKDSRRVLGMSASQGSLLAPLQASEGKAATRMRSMVSNASLTTQKELTKAKKMQGVSEWLNKLDQAAPAPRPQTVANVLPRAASSQALVGQTKDDPTSAYDEPAAVKLTADEKFQQAQELKTLINQTETGIYSHFTDMYKAFQYMDLDRSGRLNKKEIARALDLWNVPIDEAKLDLLMSTCDADGDGGVSYEEFCDKLVRETVAPAAMGKRGMQSGEAMGVSAFAMMDEQLGHGKKEKFVPTLNAY